MSDVSLWNKYCDFYERDFSAQMENSRKKIGEYFQRWRRTALARMLCGRQPDRLKEVPITTYSDYPILEEFGVEISTIRDRTRRQKGELYKDYYDRISAELGTSLNEYMAEPYYCCMLTTGTMGKYKWLVVGKSFWENLQASVISTAVLACSDSWGESTIERRDKGLNINAPIPLLSGWAAWASQSEFELVPSIDVRDNIPNFKDVVSLVLKLIEKGERISLAGGVGSLFYMMCKYFTDPEEFYGEYYNSMDFGLRKMLLSLKLVQCRISKPGQKDIRETLPLKGVMVGGMETKLYLDFFKKEFDLEPLHCYGSTEAGTLMRGDPDRKSDLLPDLRPNYLEFQTSSGELKDLDELRKGETYDLVITPYGSILFRYDMEDLLRVINFRDDGMPVFEFEGRKAAVLRLYNYNVTPNAILDALSRAGLKSSDKWAVTKILKDREHLSFVMEKTWDYDEKEAERVIFQALLDAEKAIPYRGRTFTDYVQAFNIKEPSEAVRVQYLRRGAFTRYAILKAKTGAPIGQYKPPNIIPPEKIEIYETLRSV